MWGQFSRRRRAVPATQLRRSPRRLHSRGIFIVLLIATSATTDIGRAQQQAPAQPFEQPATFAPMPPPPAVEPSAAVAAAPIAATEFAPTEFTVPPLAQQPPAGGMTFEPFGQSPPAAPPAAPKPSSPPTIQFGMPDFLVAQNPAKPGDAAKAGDKKPGEEWVDVSSEKWTVKLGGHVQLDYINWATASPAIQGAQDYFEFRRLRLFAEGGGYGMYDFRLQMTLEPDSVGETPGVTSPEVKDAYFSINDLPLLGRIRIGNFFVPVSIEQLTTSPNNVFMERSIPTQGIFTPDREVGIASYNCTPSQRMTWAYGVFFEGITDALKERIDDNQGYRLSGRATWLPYYDEPSNGRYLVYLGTNFVHTDDQNDSIRFRARPHTHEGPRLIDSGNLLADTYTTSNVEGAIVWGPVTVQSEAYLAIVNFNGRNATPVNGNYIHMSWFLTGENRVFDKFGRHGAAFGRVVPFSNFFVVRGFRSWGAWEAKARWTRLDLSNVAAGQYNDMTVGLNWYWSDRTRVMFDWIHPFTTAQTSFGAVQADILAMRFDFNW